MPFTLDQFARRFPRLYHLTAAMNVDAINRDGCLYPAAETFRQARSANLLCERRPESIVVPLPLGGGQRHIRDQLPLYEGNTALLGGWTFADFVQDLNERVFFWPGTEDGPSGYGRRHFARYAPREDVRVLRLDTAALLSANPGLLPQFCRYNSGSPRCNPKSKEAGKRSPRGPGTFLLGERFDGAVGSVVEVTFRGTVRLDGLIAGWAGA